MILCGKYSHPKHSLKLRVFFGMGGFGWRAARAAVSVRKSTRGSQSGRVGKFRSLASACASHVDRPLGKIDRAFADEERSGRGSRVAHVRARGGIGDRRRSEVGARDAARVSPGANPKKNNIAFRRVRSDRGAVEAGWTAAAGAGRSPLLGTCLGVTPEARASARLSPAAVDPTPTCTARGCASAWRRSSA